MRHNAVTISMATPVQASGMEHHSGSSWLRVRNSAVSPKSGTLATPVTRKKSPIPTRSRAIRRLMNRLFLT